MGGVWVEMIITLTGAYRNIGDHLIGDRARKLLKKYSDKEIINIDRKSIKTKHYDLFNKSKAVILCGGPAYQKSIYPNIYPIDYGKVKVPIIPMGLGWKGSVNQPPKDFHFTKESENFIRNIHKNIKFSSARDDLTLEIVKNQGIDNVLMTGCPVWYDLDYMGKGFIFKEESKIKKIIFSTPVKFDKNAVKVMMYIAQRFPKAEKVCTFHHGFYINSSLQGLKKSAGFIRGAFLAKLNGFKIADLNSKLEKIHIYDDADLHIGYRVHAHIYMLSHRLPSFIIAEDSRGTGQSLSVGLPTLDYSDTHVVNNLDQSLNEHFKTKGKSFKAAIIKMEETFKVMQQFLENI